MAETEEVWRFSRAIARAPAESAVNGLRAVDRGVPDIDALRTEHAAYVAALTEAGLAVEVLPALETFPDSVFVEDPALVFPEGAIALRPGAESRLGETAALMPVLRARFEAVHELGTGFVDGGDVLVTPGIVFIGLSERTNRDGAETLAAMLGRMGRKAQIVVPPPGVLHLKSACSLLDRNIVLATDAVADSGLLEGMRVLRVPEQETAAANALRVNEVVLLPEGYPRTTALVSEAGFEVAEVDVREAAKLDAGLSCMSLRW